MSERKKRELVKQLFSEQRSNMIRLINTLYTMCIINATHRDPKDDDYLCSNKEMVLDYFMYEVSNMPLEELSRVASDDELLSRVSSLRTVRQLESPQFDIFLTQLVSLLLKLRTWSVMRNSILHSKKNAS